MSKVKYLFGLRIFGFAVGAALCMMNAHASVLTENLFSRVTTLEEVNQKLAQARDQHKPAMLEFYASWCSVCRAFDRNVLSDKSVQKSMRPFAAIRVDVTEQNDNTDALLRYFNVYGTPTFIFYDRSGKEMASESFAGSMDKSSFEQSLKRVANAGQS